MKSLKFSILALLVSVFSNVQANELDSLAENSACKFIAGIFTAKLPESAGGLSFSTTTLPILGVSSIPFCASSLVHSGAMTTTQYLKDAFRKREARKVVDSINLLQAGQPHDHLNAYLEIQRELQEKDPSITLNKYLNELRSRSLAILK